MFNSLANVCNNACTEFLFGRLKGQTLIHKQFHYRCCIFFLFCVYNFQLQKKKKIKRMNNNNKKLKHTFYWFKWKHLLQRIEWNWMDALRWIGWQFIGLLCLFFFVCLFSFEMCNQRLFTVELQLVLLFVFGLFVCFLSYLYTALNTRRKMASVAIDASRLLLLLLNSCSCL